MLRRACVAEVFGDRLENGRRQSEVEDAVRALRRVQFQQFVVQIFEIASLGVRTGDVHVALPKSVEKFALVVFHLEADTYNV